MIPSEKTDKLKGKLHPGALHTAERQGSFDNTKEIQEASRGREAYREAVGFDESVETTGRVSEILSDDVNEQNVGSTQGAQGSKILDPVKIRENLLKNLPSEKSMKRQIEKEIKKEIKYLHKKALKMAAFPGSMSFFEMSNLVKKIRELKGILLALVKSSLDSLKTLWLRFVHGVM